MNMYPMYVNIRIVRVANRKIAAIYEENNLDIEWGLE